jgi:HYR domain-containing protein/cohesin domain-containing protein
MVKRNVTPHLFSILIPIFSLAFALSSGDILGQCALVCKGSVNVALDTSGTTTLTPPMLLQSSNGCSNNFEIEVVDTAGNSYGNVVDASLIGQPATVTITHPASGNSCSAALTVSDNMPPVMVCGSDTSFLWCNTPPDSLEAPAVSDNVSEPDSITLEYEDVFTDLECFDTVSGTPVTALFERTWTATDENGNSASCVQLFYLKRATLGMVVFPQHRDDVQMPALECAVDDPGDFEITGQPMVEGFVLDNTTSCELITSHTDQSIPVCGGAEKIIRTWMIFDLCTEDFRVFSQIIKVNDTTAPEITCPGNASFATYASSCTAQVLLPAATATDACSGATITPVWSFGTGYGPFNTVPVGSYDVTYTAEDGCGNTSSCQISVTVIDEKKPTAICENLVTVALDEDGTALIFAESFDNGSYDNCGIGQYLVSPGDNYYDEFVSFQCENLGLPMPVTLKVTDVNGLESQCVSSASVKDELPPEILCPAAISVGCGENYNNSAMTGIPYATDNCTVVSTTFTNQLNLNTCGLGSITRTWKATDQSGNASTCIQIINVVDNTPITVVFPGDILTYECEPETEPAVTGEPVVTGSDCEQLQITHTDYLFYTAEPACYKLIRNWAIINWCVYQPNDPQGAGFWDHTQVIEVRDSMPPVMSCPQNVNVGIQNAGCETFAQLPPPLVDDCSGQVAILNDSPFAQSNEGSAAGVYPLGIHIITYTAADGCGNASNCATKLTITDAQAPNPVCNNGVSVTIQQAGYVTLTPAMINLGSYDNCTPAANLILQVSPNTFDCQSLGSKTVTLTVTDANGNSAFCQTIVNVQDNFEICGNQANITIAGKMESEGGQPLSNKVVGLSGGLAIAVHTDQDGTFDFPNLPPGQDYTLTPNYNTKPMNGVTTFDMVIIRRHILGVEELGSPYKIIAADVNKSKAVSTLDLVDMQKMILNITQVFPNGNTSWRFVDAAYVFPDPKNPFAEPFPESISMQNVEASQWNRDFAGIKTGDVNASADLSGFGGDEVDDRNYSDNLTFTTQDIELVAGYEYAIPFMAKNFESIAGFQFTFEFDAAAMAFQTLKPGGLALLKDRNFGNTNAENGFVTVSWENSTNQQLTVGEVLFSLKFRATANTRLSDVLDLTSGLTPAEAYSGDPDASASTFEILGMALEFQPGDNDRLQLFQNTPNPFSERTTLSFYLPSATTATVQIYNVFGQLLFHREGSYSQGKHSMEVDLSHSPESGILLCRLNASGFSTQTIKMVVSDP